MGEVRIYVVNDNDRIREIWDEHYAHELIDALVDAGVMVPLSRLVQTKGSSDEG